MNNIAIIVAGGSGARLTSDYPKQFHLLNGKPLLMYSISAFAATNVFGTIKVVLPSDYISHWEKLCEQHHFRIDHQIIEGGTERFFSVKNALNQTDPDAMVAIHDGARPFVSPSIIVNGLDQAQKTGSAVPAITVSESVRKVEGDHSTPVDRAQLRTIQTPQIFKGSWLTEAYQQPYHPRFTDDASVVEQIGHKITLYEGEPINFKITTKDDLMLATLLAIHLWAS